MSNLFTAQDADGVSDTVVRQDHEVKSGLFEYTKTGAGTATLELKSLFSGAALITVALAAGAQEGSIEVPLPSRYYAEVSSTVSTVSIDAQVDGD